MDLLILPRGENCHLEPIARIRTLDLSQEAYCFPGTHIGTVQLMYIVCHSIPFMINIAAVQGDFSGDELH